MVWVFGLLFYSCFFFRASSGNKSSWSVSFAVYSSFISRGPLFDFKFNSLFTADVFGIGIGITCPLTF